MYIAAHARRSAPHLARFHESVTTKVHVASTRARAFTYFTTREDVRGPGAGSASFALHVDARRAQGNVSGRRNHVDFTSPSSHDLATAGRDARMGGDHDVRACRVRRARRRLWVRLL